MRHDLDGFQGLTQPSDMYYILVISNMSKNAARTLAIYCFNVTTFSETCVVAYFCQTQIEIGNHCQ